MTDACTEPKTLDSCSENQFNVPVEDLHFNLVTVLFF